MERIIMRYSPIIVAVLAALCASAPAMAAVPDVGDPPWLRTCRAQDRMESECYVAQARVLEARQDAAVRGIRARLAKAGPAGTDYAAVAQNFEAAQKAWKSYATLDCAMLDDSFQGGNGATVATVACMMDHLDTRQKLLAAWEDWLE
jgi:uncharacterized protein YecT (DUF1311 family)